MRSLIGLMALILVGCAQPPEPVSPVTIYRNTAAQIASQTDVNADRMAGNWVIRQTFADVRGISDRPTFTVAPNGDLLLRQFDEIATDGGGSATVTTSLRFVQTGPGRWSATGPLAGTAFAELWVMWMDFDSRTAAIGTPSGEFGWIMDKNTTGGGDRITAARDIMDWFGYDIEKLREVEL